MCDTIKVEVTRENRKPVLLINVAAEEGREGFDWVVTFDGSKSIGNIDGGGAAELKFSPPDTVKSVRVRTFVGDSVHEHLYRVESGEVLPSREIGCSNN